MQQRLALFDLDGTLVDRLAAYSDAVTGLCRDHGLGTPAEQWLLARLADRASPSDFTELRTVYRLDRVRRRAVAGVRRPGGGRRSRAAPQVLEGLAELRDADWTIGIASNGASDIQRAKTRRNRHR